MYLASNIPKIIFSDYQYFIISMLHLSHFSENESNDFIIPIAYFHI